MDKPQTSKHQSVIFRRSLELGSSYPVVERALVTGSKPMEIPPIVPEEIFQDVVRVILTTRRKKARDLVERLAEKYPMIAPRLWKAFRGLAEEERELKPEPAPKKKRRRQEYDWRVVVANARG